MPEARSLRQLSPNPRQRPVLDRLWRCQRAQEITEVVGERMKLEPHPIGGERSARQSRPLDRAFALLDPLLARPALVVESNDALGRAAHVRHDEADAGIKFSGMPLDLGDNPPRLAPGDRGGEVFCYAEVTWPDSVTTRLQGLADHWLVTVGLSDQRLAERIRCDGIDILVDVAGHTAGNRLLVFARKPAPVQVTWLGYPNTTGLKAIDYRLVDAVTDPAGEADVWASETLVRLEDGFLCYGGLRDGPEPTPPPCLKTGVVTFGSFNNPAKVSTATFDAWAKLLSRLPQARLILKGISFADAATRALFFARLGERGVAADRIELVTWLPGATEHLALYHRVDIALDPFPFNGTTTTCEALWMGVPVITLRGHRHAGRVGASLLTQIGLTDLIANSIEEYVEIAVALAGNSGRLDDLRHALRPRMAASTMCDEGAFACKMEAAFRTMWQHWCQVSRQ